MGCRRDADKQCTECGVQDEAVHATLDFAALTMRDVGEPFWAAMSGVSVYRDWASRNSVHDAQAEQVMDLAETVALLGGLRQVMDVMAPVDPACLAAIDGGASKVDDHDVINQGVPRGGVGKPPPPVPPVVTGTPEEPDHELPLPVSEDKRGELCCMVDSATMSMRNVSPIPIGGSLRTYQNAIALAVRYHWERRTKEFRPCYLIWIERSDVPYKGGPGRGWTDLSDVPSRTRSEWNATMPQSPDQPGYVDQDGTQEAPSDQGSGMAGATDGPGMTPGGVDPETGRRLPRKRELSGCVWVVSGCPGGPMVRFRWDQKIDADGDPPLHYSLDGKPPGRTGGIISGGLPATRRGTGLPGADQC
jgi:hypothetical protein